MNRRLSMEGHIWKSILSSRLHVGQQVIVRAAWSADNGARGHITAVNPVTYSVRLTGSLQSRYFSRNELEPIGGQSRRRRRAAPRSHAANLRRSRGVR